MHDLSDTANVGPVWTLWHGGGNYSRGHIEDVERWDTLEDALIEAGNRLSCGHWFDCHFPYAYRDHERAKTPCVDESSTVEVYLADPREHYDGNLIPDAVFELSEERGDRGEFVQAGDGDYVTRGEG